MELFREGFDEIVLPRPPRSKKWKLFSGALPPLSERRGVPSPQQDVETLEDFRCRLTKKIEQMMYVSGETAEPSTETTGMVEEIVRQQVIEMVRESRAPPCALLAFKRTFNPLYPSPLIFASQNRSSC
jgi:hypothetical protein